MMPSHCPRCGEQFPADRLEANLVICSCGWTDKAMSRASEKAATKGLLRATLIAALVLVPTVLYLSQWNGLGLEIVSLRLAKGCGFATQTQLLELAELYTRLHKFDRAEEVYAQIIHRVPSETVAYEKLIKLQTAEKKPLEVARTYLAYYQHATHPIPALRYKFALALADSGEVQQAILEFNKILQAEPEMLQVTVTHSYVQMLVQHDMLTEAAAVLKRFRARGSNGKDFLNDDVALVSSKMDSRRRVASASSTKSL